VGKWSKEYDVMEEKLREDEKRGEKVMTEEGKTHASQYDTGEGNSQQRPGTTRKRIKIRLNAIKGNHKLRSSLLVRRPPQRPR